MENQRLAFTLLELVYKKAGAVQLYDDNSLDGVGKIISFPNQVAIVTHALMLKGSPFGKLFVRGSFQGTVSRA